MYGTSDRIGHRTIERKSPSSEENLYVRKKTRKGSEENCIGYEKYEHVCTMYMIGLYYSMVYTYHIHGSDMYTGTVYTRLCRGVRIPDDQTHLATSHGLWDCQGELAE